MGTPQTSLEHAADVLVVDDDIGICKIVSFALEDAGYAVYEAHDGLQALDRLRAHPHGLIVLLDLNMPRLDGWGVLRKVKAEARLAMRHKFLLVTASSEMLPSRLVNLLSDLRIPVLAKPCGLDRILDAVAHAASVVSAADIPGSATVR